MIKDSDFVNDEYKSKKISLRNKSEGKKSDNWAKDDVIKKPVADSELQQTFQARSNKPIKSVGVQQRLLTRNVDALKQPNGHKKLTNATESKSNETDNTTNTADMKKAVSAIKMEIPDNSRVILMGFHSVNQWYVRCAQDDNEYKDIIKRIDDYGHLNRIPLRFGPRKNFTAITYLNKPNGILARCIVQDHYSNDRFKVLFCDFGIVSTRHLSELRQCNVQIMNMPKYLKLVQLRDVKLILGNESISAFLALLKNKEYIIKYVKNESRATEVAMVSLISPETGQRVNDTVNQFLLSTGETQIKQNKNEYNRVSKDVTSKNVSLQERLQLKSKPIKNGQPKDNKNQNNNQTPNEDNPQLLKLLKHLKLD